MSPEKLRTLKNIDRQQSQGLCKTSTAKARYWPPTTIGGSHLTRNTLRRRGGNGWPSVAGRD